MEMHPLYLFLDPYLIWFYRLTGHAVLNFLVGTFVLAWLALLVGECTSYLAALLVKPHVERVTGEAKKYQDLSIEALKAGDRPAYEAANKLANEAFGKSFFMQLTLSATFFWPVFYVLGWMQYRFLELEFPLPFIGVSLGYIGAFIPIYILAYLLFKQIKSRLPLCRRRAAAEPGPVSLLPSGHKHSEL
jgi:hypothetical protein